MGKIFKIIEIVKAVLGVILPHLKARREKKVADHLVNAIEVFSQIVKDGGKTLKKMIASTARGKINKWINKKLNK